MSRFWRFLGSLWLTIPVLLVLAGILIAATWISTGYDVTVGSLRRDFYGSWWFNILLGILAINLIVCTVRRKPWQFWQWGFLVTHAGVLTLMIGAAVSFNWKIYGNMAIREGGKAAEFEVEGERELVIGDQRHKLDLNPYVRSKPGRTYLVGNQVLELEEYIPNVGESFVYETMPGGKSDVLEVKTYFDDRSEDPLQLVAGEVFGNNLLAYRYVVDNPALYQNLIGDGVLALTMDGETREISVKDNVGKPVQVGKRVVTIQRVFGNFTIGRNDEPMEGRGGDMNPAVAFDVKHGEATQTFYAFTLWPELSPLNRNHVSADFQAAYRYAPKQGFAWFFLIDGEIRYVITTVGGLKSSGQVKLGERIAHPKMAAALQFEVVRRIPNAESMLKEEPPRKGRTAQPAIKLRLGEHRAWLRIDETAQLGNVKVQFVPRIYKNLNLVVELKKFRNPPHEGTGRASKFESTLKIYDPATGKSVEGATGVNYPFSYKGWSFYQSAYNDKVTPVVSILQVSYDPGKRVLYLGCLMTLSGTIFMLFLKRGFLTLVQTSKKAADPVMTFPTWIFLLTVACVGTVGGALLIPYVDGLLLGSIEAGVSLVLALAFAAWARRRSASHPRFALGLGRIVAAAWCINTAALSLLMFTKVS